MQFEKIKSKLFLSELGTVKDSQFKPSYSDLKEIINALIIASEKINISQVAIVGGVIRDQLAHYYLQVPLKKIKDLDIIIEGSASTLARQIQNNLGSKRVAIIRDNSSYNTIQIEIDEIRIDIASSRKEIYPKPGENPKIEAASLKEDLRRRDFTLNAIAIDIKKNIVIDLYQGQDAIKNRQLKFIHSQSVTDDPTRVIRAARYAARLGFKLAPIALQQINSTIEEWPWSWQSGESASSAPPALSTRLRMELEILFKEEAWEKALTNLESWGALLLLDSDIQNDQDWGRRIKWGLKLNINPLTALIAGASNRLELAERLQLSIQQQKILGESIEIENFCKSINLTKNCLTWSPSKWSNEIELRNWHSEAIAIAVCLGTPHWHSLLRWVRRWRLIQSPTSAKELIKEGWEPGPNLREELKRRRYKKLDRLY
tara:strand:- start:67745 stop:69034 length:1290 start_codon:yes stop_codon:yes gene_type:complete